MAKASAPLPLLSISRPRIDRVRFTLGTVQTWATESLVVRTRPKNRYVVLTGCFHAYATGNESLSERHLGPFASPSDAANACAAIDEALGLPRTPTRVTEHDLRADPARFHNAHVEVVGQWSFGFERSSFAGAWLEAPIAFASGAPHVTKRVRACGFWHAGKEGYGHMGASSAELLAYEVVDILPPPEVPKKVWLRDVLITFEQNGEFDEWRILANGATLPMIVDEEPATWLPLGPCLRSREPFQSAGSWAWCTWSTSSADIQGTVVYLSDEIKLAFNADKSAIIVKFEQRADTSA